ncbi:MAG: glycosyltransferase family 39 protein [Gemmataceae bacterium]|nr:glycosyltransferase family 39 protein [Gemmataceae bacterium]
MSADTAADSQGKPAQELSAPTAWAILGLIVVAGVILRAYRLGERSFWYDEAFSWRLTTFSWHEMLERAALDVHPPLYYALLKLWSMAFGSTAWALRSFSVAMGAVSIVAMYLFVAEAFGRRHSLGPLASGQVEKLSPRSCSARGPGLLVAALVAVSAFQIRYGWEARMYALGAALAALSSWLLFRALHATLHANGKSFVPWLLYAIAVLLFAYTHYYALFTIAVQWLFLAGWFLTRHRLRIIDALKDPACLRAAWAIALVIVGWLPSLPVFLRQRAQVQANYWTQPIDAWQVPMVCHRMVFEPENATPSRRDAALVAAVCAAILLGLLWRARAAEWHLLLAATGPLLLSVAVSAWDTKIFHPRFFIVSHLFLLASFGVVLWRLPAGWERNVIVAVVLANCLWIYVSFWERLDLVNKPGGRAAARWIAENRQPGELAVVCNPMVYLPLIFHAGDDGAWRVYHDGRGVLHYEGASVLAPREMFTADDWSRMEARRVWVVDIAEGGWGTRSVPAPPGWEMTEEKRFPEALRVQGVTIVRLYEKI